MVWDGIEFLLGGTSHTDVQFLVELARVAGDDFSAEFFCKANGIGCFAYGGGTCYDVKGFRVWVILEFKTERLRR